MPRLCLEGAPWTCLRMRGCAPASKDLTALLPLQEGEKRVQGWLSAFCCISLPAHGLHTPPHPG